MDPKDVERPGDIVSAADALLKAAPKPPDTQPDPGVADPPAPEQPAGDTEPAADGAPPDGEGDEAQRALDDPLAERSRLLAEQEAAFEKRKADAEAGFKKILEDPTEYKRTRQQLGLEQPEPAEPPKPVGPDPITNPDAWRYRREQVYYRDPRARTESWTPDAIREAVERDLIEAHDAVYHERLQKIEGRISQREKQEQEWLAGQRAQQAQTELTKQLAPLTRAAYPKGVPQDAQEDIDAHVALARARGQTPDLAAIVAKVSGKQKAAITGYVAQKKAMATGTAAARSTGGQSPAPTSILDRLPAEVGSIGKIGELLAEGKLKR